MYDGYYTTDTNLGFGGYVGKVLSKAAGPRLEAECKSVTKPITVGDIVTTGGYNLKSKHIIHVVLPGYSGANSEQVIINWYLIKYY